LGRVRRVMWKSEISKVVALFVSVKDRWVNTHEQILNVLIACCLMTALVFEGGALLLGDVIMVFFKQSSRSELFFHETSWSGVSDGQFSWSKNHCNQEAFSGL
jgi:hypothetical protein